MKIVSLELQAADLPALKAFYGERFGLPLCEDADGRISFQAGATRLTFTRAPDDWRGYYHFAFNVPENRFEEALAWLAARTPASKPYDFENWDAHAVYFDDPAGNIGELIARHSLPSSRREAMAILSVSEIGRVVDSVPAAVEELGLPIYRGSSESFAPVGDEDGLVILVQRGRTWFGTDDRRAEPAPFIATLTDGSTITG